MLSHAPTQSSLDPTAATPADPAPPPHRALVALCLTQITSWGVLFYSFPVLAGSVAADTGWSTSAAMGAFSAGLAVSAAAGVPAGRLLDRHGPRPVMTTGSILGVAAVVAIALAPGFWQFAAAWAFSGLAQACVFYKPAFAALTVWYGNGRVRALTVLTLVAGLSSTVFAPLTATLDAHMSWREVYLVLAVLLAAVTVPLHAVLLTPPWPRQAAARRHGRRGSRSLWPGPTRSAEFLVLSAAMALATFALFAATLYLVPLLTERGMHTATAAWALGLCGAGQLLGRIGYAPLAARTSPAVRTVLVIAGAGVSVAAVSLVPSPAVLVFAVVIVMGAVRGAFTLLEATAVSDRWGSQSFGEIYAIFSAPATLALAVGPLAGALLASRLGGMAPLFGCLAALAAVAALLAVISARRGSVSTS